jgi:putative DNA primase/helicase
MGEEAAKGEKLVSYGYRDNPMVRCLNHWQSILLRMGADPKWLRNLHQPCPFCGGKDRYRFDDKDGRGTYFCSHCGAGDGISFIMNWKSCNFVEAVKLIEAVIGGSPLDVRRRSDPITGEVQAPIAPDITEIANRTRTMWTRAKELDGTDVASRYLKMRAIVLKVWPSNALRWAQSIQYWIDGEMIGYFPAMIARFVAPDESAQVLQRTYLEEPGRKARVDECRKLTPGPIPIGGAVRLGEAAEVMGVAEGVETALAASLLNRGMPVWATLTTINMMKFEPPPICKKLIIFGDRDPKAAGEAAAFALAHRLEMRKNSVETERRVPGSGAGDHPWLRSKRDWADVLWETKHPGVV